MSALKERLEGLLTKPMTRQEFLRNVGLLLLGVVGVTSVLSTFEGKRTQQVSSSAQTYGGAAYGGEKRA